MTWGEYNAGHLQCSKKNAKGFVKNKNPAPAKAQGFKKLINLSSSKNGERAALAYDFNSGIAQQVF